jgi:hypothetical protein
MQFYGNVSDNRWNFKSHVRKIKLDNGKVLAMERICGDL